eukprot:2729614-Pyramimonas_sp.AAC.1
MLEPSEDRLAAAEETQHLTPSLGWYLDGKSSLRFFTSQVAPCACTAAADRSLHILAPEWNAASRRKF